MHVLTVLLAAMAASISAACSSSRSGGDETELVAISYAGATQVPHRKFLADPFEAAHRSVKVTLVPSESEDVVAQIKAARGASPYDVIPLGEPRQLTAIREGWIERTPAEELPNLKDVHPQFVEACKEHGVPETYSLMGLAYNPDLVPRPAAWTALWNPEYQGRIGLTTPASNLGFAFVVLTAKLFGGGEENLEPAWERLKQLEPFVVASNPTSLAQLFERQEIAIAPLWNNDAAVLAGKKLNVRFVQPAPGAMILVSCLNVIATTAHPTLARDFINRVISAEYQRQAVQAPWFFGPTNRNVAIPAEASDYLPATDDARTTLMRLDWSVATDMRGAATDRFNREFRR
jgi:putative spermidine/putrescine transport system substrate-binding protein